MSDYLPDVYLTFRDQFPTVATALDQLGRVTEAAGPLDPRSQRLVKLGIAIGALAEGAVRSNVRKALDQGASSVEIHHVVTLAITTVGFPATVAALGWVDEVLEATSAA
jgi:alkylhydroperoxidase/carboxymuconolactone decarboxylase family protein YurZ